jgi:hypothetical protein
MPSQPKFKKGDKVILGEHQEKDSPSGTKNWSSRMDQYVGREATITTNALLVDDVIYMHQVDVDNGNFYWREVNMTPAGRVVVIGTISQSGAKCKRCGEYNEFVPASDTFTCYGCRH